VKNRNAEWIAQMLIVAMFAVAIWTWPSAPARIPIHWDITGQVNGYGSKAVGLFLLPVIALVGYALIGWAPKMNPARPVEWSALSWFGAAYVLLMAGVFGVVVADARGSNVNMNYIVFPLVALLWIAIANLLVRSGRAKAARTTPSGGIRI
jgi:immunity protein, SdpI family